MTQPILIFAEQREGSLKKSAFEVATAGREVQKRVGGTLSAVLIGKGIAKLSEQLGRYGVEKVHLWDADSLAYYTNETYTHAFCQTVTSVQPQLVLFSATTMGKDLAPRVSARMKSALFSDCIGIEVKEGRFYFTRPMYAGKAIATFTAKTPIQMATLRPNVFTAKEEGERSPEVISYPFSFDTPKVAFKELLLSQNGTVDVSEADIIVSGGRGLQKKENFYLIEELASALGGAVGASRAAVDAGWREHGAQVGQTGKAVSPSLYIACGISGAIQHLAGMSSSKCIVAINNNVDAPIFKVADYGIVGDLFEVVPEMTRLFKEEKAE